MPERLIDRFVELRKDGDSESNVLLTPAHICYIEQDLGRQVETRTRVTDDDLVGKEGCLFQVYGAHQIDLSAEVRRRTGIWSAEPIIKGSAAANALVRLAASITLWTRRS